MLEILWSSGSDRLKNYLKQYKFCYITEITGPVTYGEKRLDMKPRTYRTVSIMIQ